MPTAEQLASIITCLSGTYPAFVSTQLTKLAKQALGIAQSGNDPLSTLMKTNVSQLTGTASSLVKGDVISTVATTGAAVLYNEVISQQLTVALNAVYAKYPAAKSFVEHAENGAESAIGLVHLFLSLSVEAPYAIAQIVLEGALPVVDQKQRIIGCISGLTAQVSNTMMTLAKNPAQAQLQIQITISKLQTELQAAQLDFRTCIANLQRAIQGIAPTQINYGTTGGFLVQRFTSGQVHLQNADVLLSPALPVGNTVLGYAKPLLAAAAGDEFLTDASRQLALVVLGSLVGVMQNMMKSLNTTTILLNLYITNVQGLTDQLKSLQTNQKLNSLRLKLLQGIDAQLTYLISSVSQNSEPKASTYSLLAIGWSAAIRVLRTQTDKVINATLTDAGVSTDDQNLINLRLKLGKILTAMEKLTILPNIVSAIDDVATLQDQAGTFLSGANNLMYQLSSVSNPLQAAVVSHSLIALMGQVAPLGNAIQTRLEESGQTLVELVPLINEFLAVDIPVKAQIQQILLILDKAGMNRASDLLRAGRVADFMGTSFMSATYAGFAAQCLINDIANAPDSQTADDLQSLLDDANTELLSASVTASDVLNTGVSQYYSNIQTQIAAANLNAQTAEGIIARMTTLAKQLGHEVAAAASTASLSQVINSAGSDLDAALRAVTTAGLGFPGCD